MNIHSRFMTKKHNLGIRVVVEAEDFPPTVLYFPILCLFALMVSVD